MKHILLALSALLLSGSLLAQPPNDNCTDADIFALTAGSSVIRTGNNEGATDQIGLGVPHVWEAFTITECLDITIAYCGTTPAFTSAHRMLYVGCNVGSGFDNNVRHPDTGVEQTSCGDGNFTIPYFQVPPGTYYYLVESQAGSIGDYTITFTGTACSATAPVNDECSGAITLVPNETCVTITGDVDGANAGVSLPAITCAGWTGDASDDVWFQFEATATEHTIQVMPSSQFDATVDLRSGTCGSTMNIYCSEIGGSGGMEMIQATGLTVGMTYYVRVYDWWSGLALSTTFEICVTGTSGGDCAALAGTLQGGSAQTCLVDGEATLIATPSGNAVVPPGYDLVYLLTMGMDQVVMDASLIAEFGVDMVGTYTIHTLVYDETTLDLNDVILGETTAAEVNALLIQGGGEICASLDIVGVTFIVEDCIPCDAIAGTLEGGSSSTCLVAGEAMLMATPAGDAVVPAGFNTVLVLTMGDELVIIDTALTPDFTVTELGTYAIHTLVYDPATLDLSTIQFGTTTGAEIYALLVQGGGDICANLDVTGAMFTVVECIPCDADAGTLTPVLGSLCLIDGMASMEAIVNEDAVIPMDYEQVFVLTQGFSMVIVDVSLIPVFEVSSIGNFTIHSLVFDPATLNLNDIALGVTTAAQVNAMLQQGGGSICASLDLIGASFVVSDCTPSNDDCSTAFGLNIYETGNCTGNEVEGTTIFSSFSGVEPACDPSDAGYADVWYVFNSGDNTQVFIDVTATSTTSWGVAVYMDCDGMDLVACEAEPAAPMVINTTTDTEYLVMVYTNLQSGQTGEFNICLTATEAVNFCLGGTVSTNMGEEDLLICTSDPMGPITFVSAGVAAQNYTYILTDANGEIIDLLVGNTMDFGDAPVGTYQIHGVSYNGTLIGAEEGEMITGLTSSGDCISVSDNYVTITVDICTSIGDRHSSLDWSIYPNPTNGEMNILYSGESGTVLLQLIDMSGRIVASQQLQLNSGERHPVTVNEVLAPGMYNVTLTIGENRSSTRLIVQ